MSTISSYPLSETQMGMFLEWDADRSSNRYTIAVGQSFPAGSVDPDRLAKATEEAFAAEPVYRTRFIDEEGEIRQYIDDTLSIEVKRTRSTEAEADSRRYFARGFDAFNGPFARAELIETPQSIRLQIEIFHTIIDGTSLKLLLCDIASRYEGRQPNAPSLPFAECVAIEKNGFDTPEYEEAKADAIRRFTGKSMTVPDSRECRGGNHETVLGDFHKSTCLLQRSAIDAFLRNNGIHPNLFFMGVFARTLSLFANEKDVVFWTVNHGRRRIPELATASGCHIKTVPVLAVMEGKATVADYLESLKLHKAGVYPFTRFCNDLGMKPGWGFTYQSGTVDFNLELDGVTAQHWSPVTDGSGEMPVVQVYSSSDSYQLEISCQPGRYGLDFISGFIGRMKTIAENLAAAAADTPLSEIAVLDAAEAEKAMAMAFGGEMEYDAGKTFVDLFREYARKTPDATAVVDRNGSATYAQLDARSDAFAAALIAEGVKPNGFVAVGLHRGMDFIVAAIAAQKCGCGYIPIDPEYPQDRIDYIVSDSEAKILVTEEWLNGKDLSKPPREAPDFASPATPAYMIYTSGSTGRPKGVVVSNRALANIVEWFHGELCVGPGKRNIHLVSFSFDASIPDIFATLAHGAELHILDEEQRKDLFAVADYCVRNAITGAVVSTQMGLALVNSCPDLPLEYMMLGGEKMTAFAKTPVRMFNGYGPTEFCVCSSCHEVDQSKSYDIPIGRAMPNTWSFVVDKLGQPVPHGMTGEIALAGIQLSDGYWRKPEKTESVFVRIPFNFHCSEFVSETAMRLGREKEADGIGPFPGTPAPILSLMYLTGDLGKYNQDGELEFQGRIDFQVKLRGFRIEIGEIEHAASTFPGVKGVVALVRKISGTDHLVLYYEGGDDTPDFNTRLKGHLAKTLTPYMVPDFFVAMKKLPSTPGGKIDRKALPLPKSEDKPVIAPRNELEKTILDAVSAVVKRDDIGITHDFNDIGLTSLGAMELVVKLKKAAIKVSLRQLADNPTVRDLAALVASAPERRVTEARKTVAKHYRRATFPMTENQRGIYVDWLRNPGTTQYNIPAAIRFPGTDATKLANAAVKAISAHASFAVQFVEKDGEIVQEVRDKREEPIAIEIEKTDQVPNEEFFAKQVKPFQIKGEPLVRAKVYAAGDASWLFIDAHHTIFDGFSVGVLLKELVRVLDGNDPIGEECSLLDAALDERDYLSGDVATDDERWFERYIDGLESTRFEESAPNTVTISESGNCGRKSKTVPAAAIVARCSAIGVTASDFFLTVFTELLKRVGRNEDVMINFVSAGRSDPDFADATGMFVKTLPLKGVKDAKTFEEAAKRIHANVRDIIDRERVSYVRLSEKFGLRPNIIFAFEGGLFDLPGGASIISPRLDTAKAPLSTTVTPTTDGFELAFEFDRTMYSDADMENLMSMFATLADGATRQNTLAEIPLVSEDVAAEVIAKSYGGDLAYDTDETLADIVCKHAAARPNAIAVVDCEKSLTYSELDAISNKIASVLIGMGVEPNGYVGVKLPRRVEFIASALAAQKCGCGYIPMDPEYPRDRIDYMLENSGAKTLITESWLEENLKDANAAKNGNGQAINRSRPDLPAYMIYTSGSTGRPKGVSVPNSALRNLVAWTMHSLRLSAGSRICTHASFSFDASVIDIFPALAAGGELHIFSEELRKDLAGLRDYIVKHGIQGGTMSTQIGMALVNTYPDMPCEFIQMGGEKMLKVAKTDIRLINGYGPTEFCVCSSFEEVDQEKDGDIPIGRPVANSYSLIVDRYGHLLPLGFAGELALAGLQMSSGYWRNREKTESAFIKPPFSLKYQTLYKTGDLARYNADGKLDYLGRLDFQVKLRGFRIEIGEIESVAKAVSNIGAVAAEVREVGGAKHLVLYYEKPKDGSITDIGKFEEKLKASLAERLTSYMVPDYYVGLDTIPTTPNGKINRKLLKSPSGKDSQHAFVEPATDTERTIARIFQDTVGIQHCGATDDFFDIGGTSITAIMTIVALQKAGLEVQYGDIFKYKTPRALAAFITGETAVETEEGPAATTPAFDFGDWDYTGINALLSHTQSDLFDGFTCHPLGTVLLTGATGYLGMHILKYLLERTGSKIYVLVRSKKGVSPEKRVDSQYVYYFGMKVPKQHKHRLAFIEGDITDAGLPDSKIEADTVINCAAMVKHFVADDAMDKVNVGGVENLVRLCERIGARLVHASTYSIGGTIRADSAVALDERHLYIGQESDNDYVRTKFLAERLILEATAKGKIRGKIMRLGNLMGRESDGEFQMNLGANAFVNSLKTYKALGAYPLMELAKPLEMSPIDRVAEAICLLATTPDSMCVFHPYNRYALDMGAVIAAMNSRGFDIDSVSNVEFEAHVDALRNDPVHAADLQGILHYAGHLLENRKATPTDNTWTTTVLYRLGFRWKPAEDRYLANFFQMLEGLAAFD